MGYEISYCASCQNQVRGVDLEKRLAIRVDDHAYCSKCAPGVLKSLPAARQDEILGRVPPPIRKNSTSRIPKVQSITSGRLKAQPAAPPPTPRKQGPPDRKPLLIASAVGAAVLVVAVIGMLLNGGSSNEVPPPPAPPPAPVKKTEKPADNFEASKALADLDQLVASSAEPMEILIRCDEIKGVVRGTPQETRWREIQARATEAKKGRDADQAITMGLEQVRSLRKFDLRFEKQGEIHNLLDKMKAMGGPRQAEVAKVKEEYAREAKEAEARFRGLAAWYRFSMAERLGADDSGHAYTASSTEGVTWNGGFPDGGRGARFSGSGVILIPVAIRDDFTIAFWLRTRQPPIGKLQWFEGQGLVDAEFPGIVDDFGTALLQGKFAFGVGNPDTTLRSRSTINDGVWHHVAATRESGSGKMTVYVDGAPEGTTTGPPGAKSLPNRMVIGGLQTGANLYVGELDDVRLYTRTLTTDEIRGLATPPGR